jgi:nitrogen fixation/metabolism regulation signal transduction histidine kinase
MRSLRTQILVVLLGVTLVPLGLVCVLSWQMLEAATGLGFHGEVEAALRLGAEEARDRHRAEAAALRAAEALLERAPLPGCGPASELLGGLGLKTLCQAPGASLPPAASALEPSVPGPGGKQQGQDGRGPQLGVLRYEDGTLLYWHPSERPAAESFERLRTASVSYAHLSRLRSGLTRRFLWIYLLLGCALTVGAFVLGRRFSVRILDPVERVMKAVARIGAGQSGVRLGERPRGELGELMGAVERMDRELQHGRERLIFLEKVSHWQEVARRLAHEIQNPLTPIQLIGQELRAKYHSADPGFAGLLDSSVEIIENEVASLRRLVGTFSSFARLPGPQPRPLDLTELLGGFLDSRRALHPEVEIAYEGPAYLLIEADADLLRLVLRNLVDNSVEAMGGRGRITVRLERLAPGAVAELLFRDTGPGVPADLRERIFDPYVSSRSRGSGLGLAICRKIALDHGWELDLAPSEAGACFRLRLGSAKGGAA